MITNNVFKIIDSGYLAVDTLISRMASRAHQSGGIPSMHISIHFCSFRVCPDSDYVWACHVCMCVFEMVPRQSWARIKLAGAVTKRCACIRITACVYACMHVYVCTFITE